MDWDSNASDFFKEIPTFDGHHHHLFQFNATTNDLIKTSSILLTSSPSSSSSSFENSTNSLSSTSSSSLSSLNNNITNQTLRIYPALSFYNDLLDATFIDKINSFWLEFSPPTPRAQYLFAVIYIIIMTIGIIGNAFVIYMFIRCKSLRTPANILVINLSISDFFMVAKSPIAVYNGFKLGPALGDLGCRLYGFIGGLTGIGSIATLTAIALDRYHVIVYPLDPLRSTTKIRSRLMILFIWLYSFIFSIIPLIEIGFSKYVPEGYLTTCSFDYLSQSSKERIFMLIFFIAAWFIPFLIISYCYFYILKVVIAANSIQSSKDKNKTEIKLAVIVIGIIFIWFIAWTPYAIVALIGITGNHKKFLTPFLSMVPAVFCKSSACIDPYIYAITHPRFRMEFRRIFYGELPLKFKRTSTFRSSAYATNRMSTTRRHDVIGDIDNKNCIKKTIDSDDKTEMISTNQEQQHKPTTSKRNLSSISTSIQKHNNNINNNNNNDNKNNQLNCDESSFTVEIPKF